MLFGKLNSEVDFGVTSENREVHAIWVLLGSPGPLDLGSPGFTWSM